MSTQTIPPALLPTDALAATTGIPSFGTEIQVLSSATPEEFTTIAGVGDIDGPSTSVAEVETTSHSTGKPHRTFIPTLIDDGSLSFPCFFNPSDPTHSLYSPFGLENLFQNRAVTKFRLIDVDASRRTRIFRGFVKELGETAPVAGVYTRQTSIRITEAPADVVAAVTLTPTDNLLETAAGGAQTITVASTDTVAWGATSNAPWLTVTAPTAPVIGAGTVNYTVAAQLPAAPSRTGTIMVGDKSFTVTQAAGA